MNANDQHMNTPTRRNGIGTLFGKQLPTRSRHATGAFVGMLLGLALASSVQAAPGVSLGAPANGTLIGTDTTSPYSISWANPPVGVYTLTAKATDSTGSAATTAARSVTVLAAPEARLYFLHTDYLDTPRLVTDETNKIVWRSKPLTEPFGLSPVEEDPDGDGTAFTLNLRFPGQYFDKESNLHYNYFRDYDPNTGRYIESDPIGLLGGINPYAYVSGQPLRYVDPFGLAAKCKTVLKLPFAEIQSCEEDGRLPADQDAKDAKRMTDKELDKACKNNGYKDAHDMKRDLGLDSKNDIFVDKNGNMYSGPRQGTGTPQYLHMNTSGVH